MHEAFGDMQVSNESLKVVVFLGAADSELRAEIEQCPPRARASRLRALANLGLQLRQGVASPQQPLPVASPSVQAPAPPQKEAAKRLTNKLRMSLPG